MVATAKLFWNGRSQAVRLPAEFRFEGTEVNIRRDPLTDEVILSRRPEGKGSWADFFAAREQLEADGVLDDLVIEREDGDHEREDPLA